MTDVPSPGIIESPLIKVGGTALTDANTKQLTDCRVELAIGRPGRAVLRFFDPEFSMIDSATFTIGKVLDVSFTAGATIKPVFNGEIVTVGLETGPNDEPVFIVTAYDKGHRLSRKSVVKVYKDSKYSDIVSAIAGRNSLTAQATATTQVFEHLIQQSDDASMLDEIAKATGMVWWVEGTKLMMKEPTMAGATVTLTMRVNLRRLRVNATASAVTSTVKVIGWDAKSKAAITGTSSSLPAQLATSTLSTGARGAPTQFGVNERTTSRRSVLSVSEAETVAKSLHRRAGTDEIDLRGEADGNADIKLGSTITLAGVGTKLAGDYFVTAVEHQYSGRAFRTRFTSAGTSQSTLVDLLGGGQTRWQSQGPVIGVVTEVGKETFAGSVKVKLPTLGVDMVSGWARVVTVGGGKLRGFMVLPTIDDEVLVTFEDGDLRRPVVLGGLWNGKDKVPTQPVFNGAGAVAEWVVQSPVGHTLTFRDGDGDDKQNVEIALKDKTIKLFVGTDKVELFAKDGKPLQIKSGDASITLTAAGDVEIKGKNVKITSTADTSIAGANIKAEAQAKVTLKGTAGFEATGATVKIEGQGPTEIKGAIVKIN